MKTVTEYFGCDVFSASVMKERLPAETYAELERTLETGHRLDLDVANVIANAMKDWAIEKVQLIIPIGFNLLQALLPKSTTALSPPPKRAA